MKKLIFISLCFFSTIVAAQNTPPRGSSYTDSVRSQQNRYPIKDPGNVSMSPAMDIIENLNRTKEHPLFLEIIRQSDLVATFKSRGPITLFLPPDSAIKSKLGQARLDTLFKPQHKYDLVNIVSYHAMAGRWDAKSISKQIKDGHGQATLLTLSGSKLTAQLDANRNIVLTDELGGQNTIQRFNIQQSNGLIHIVNNMLVPKDKAF